MSFTLSVTDDQVFTAFSAWLQLILGLDENHVVKEMVNRASTPKGGYVQMNHVTKDRLGTNVDSFANFQATFTGSVAGNLLTVSDLVGTIEPGMWLQGPADSGLLPGTTIVGPGAAPETYELSISNPTIPACEMYCYWTQKTSTESVDYILQADTYGQSAADWASIISATWRSSGAAHFFETYGFAPLYEESPKHVPYVSGEKQYEERWATRLHLQYNPSVQEPIQSATSLTVTIRSVATLGAPIS